ncbi:MAG: CoB--CoM heterodisulfide reductase iron-sulfur subunit B family protein, partial [Armatimonadota bacterium]|nr:CoB--CoM heterodisulfide reductase iron-sulfur subunit B family protein [Armatimonadota bacterium]
RPTVNYAYFPGCSQQGMAAEFDWSARLACERLGVVLEEVPDWVCCGATPAHATNHLLSIALPTITLAKVEEAGSGATLVAACASCYSRLRAANHEMRADPALRERVARVAEVAYQGSVVVRHLLDVLVNDVGVDAIREKVTRPLSGLKVACYYGCLLVRPPKVAAFDDPENPSFMERILEAAGAECVDWPYKTECCGSSFSLSRSDLVVKLVNDILREARDAGAQAVAVACPLCQSNLDMRQLDVAKRFPTRYEMPVFYFTQLLGLALGVDAKSLGLHRLIVDPSRVLAGTAA